VLEVVYEYVYLGVTMNYNGSFNKAIQRLCDIANRAMFELIKKSRSLFLDIDTILKLFDSTIVPILLYGSEVWGYSNSDLIERLHLRFCKIVLHVKKCTTSSMVYGELGRLPLKRHIQSRMLNFWIRLATCSHEKLSCSLYSLMLGIHVNNNVECGWLQCIKSTLNNIGLSNVWMAQGQGFNLAWFKNTVKQRLFDTSQQTWQCSLNTSSKCINYRIFKNTFGFEHYLNYLPFKARQLFTRFRCSNHRLPVELGSYTDTPRHLRLCTICEDIQVGDEYHYVFECPYFDNVRCSLIKDSYSNIPSSFKFNVLFNSNGEELTKLCKLIQLIMKTVC